MARLLGLETVDLPSQPRLVIVTYMTEQGVRLAHMPLWRAEELGLIEALQDGRFIFASELEDASV
ncbi:hypothetical protein [Roseomonas populi]|uniref:Uncharacterized protein n=1 Tax=Roseomonas populi TaxID=3121582 RepID=A0ABT1X0V9_9PROT|nr:hypothetical protein [Roseomonas pecuniae]MCR0980599.1 hypothetical protein [Roseomonas pecuniae]